MKVLKTLNLIFGIFFLFLLLYYVFFPSALLSMIDKHTLTNVLIILTLYLTTIGTVTFMAYRLKLKAPNWGLFTVFCPFLAPIVLSLKPKILDSIRDFFKKKPREEKFRYKVDKIKSSGDTGELLKALGHKKEAYRLEAAKALINSDDQEVMEQFIHRLVHLDQNLRRFVMETISKIRRSSAVVPLLGLLNE